MPRDDAELRSVFDDQAGSAGGSRELCDLFGLDAGGTHAARRDRILSLVDGPPSRRRWGWLDLLLQVHAAGARSVEELEPEDLETDDLATDDDADVRLVPGSTDLLLDLRERCPPAMDNAPPFSVLPDLVRTAQEDGRTVFQLSSPLAPSAVLAGRESVASAADSVGPDSNDFPDVHQLEARIRASLLKDIRDGNLVVPSDSSVASHRSAFAFDFDPERIILLGMQRDDRGDRKLLCGPLRPDDPEPSVAMDADLFNATLFASSISKKDVDVINRRNLLPDSTFRDAPELAGVDIGLLGGKNSKAFKDWESRRIEQQALLKPVQCNFRALAGASEVFLQLQDCLDGLEIGHTVDADLLGQLQLAHRCASDIIAAESDAVLLSSSRITELEIQKDEIFVRTTAEEAGYVADRFSGKASRNVKDTSHLLQKAADVRRVNKERQALQGQSRQKGGERSGKGQKGRKPNRKEREKRAAQSKADKEKAAANKRKQQEDSKGNQ